MTAANGLTLGILWRRYKDFPPLLVLDAATALLEYEMDKGRHD